MLGTFQQKKNLKESEKWQTMKDLENVRDYYGKQIKKKGIAMNPRVELGVYKVT